MSPKVPWRRWRSRLARVTWDELRMRLGQEVTKRWDAALYRLGVPPRAILAGSQPGLGAAFVFSTKELPQLLELLRARLPSEVDRTIAEADRICRHRFDLLGYKNIDYGPEIDWHLDAVHGKRVPRKPWFRIPYLEFDQVGDHKVTWELNRHQHLLVLAKAYRLTQERRYASEIFRLWYHWQKQNPYPIGINWASSLEVAFRSLSWLWIRQLLAGCPVAPKQFQTDLHQALALNGRHISRYLSTYFSPNTHLLGEGVALFFIGTLCPDLAPAKHWQQQGWQIVQREADRQVQPDGMHFEQSVYYHVYALDFLLHARTLAVRNEIPIPAQLDETLVRMLDVLRVLGQAGNPPRLGDDDGGRVFDPRRNRAEHMLDPLTVGAIIFGRPDFKAACRGLTEESVWLLGSEGVAQFDQLPATRRTLLSAQLKSSGICVMAGSKPVPHQVVIDAGPQGIGNAGHGHADALSLQVSVAGREWLADPGTGDYISHGENRDLFRGTSSHNTMQVDGIDQAEPATLFSWRLVPQVRINQWSMGETFDLFEGIHTGYSRLREPVIHRRWVFNLKSRFWVIRDQAEGKGHHELALNWHLASEFQPQATGSTAAILQSRERDHLVFLPARGHGWSQEISRGKISDAYGKAEPNIVLRFVRSTFLPAEFAVVVLPFETSIQEVTSIGGLVQLDEKQDTAKVRGYRYDRPGEIHFMFFANCNGTWNLGPWESNAQFLYCGIAPAGRQHWILCGGSYAEIGGHRVVACRQPVDRYEWTSAKGREQLFCSDESAISQSPEETLALAHAALLSHGAVGLSGRLS